MFSTVINVFCTLTNFAFAGYDTYTTCQKIKGKYDRNEPIPLQDKLEVSAKVTGLAVNVLSMGTTAFNSITEKSILSNMESISGVQEKLSHATKISGSLCDQT